MIRITSLISLLVISIHAFGGEITAPKDADTGWRVFTIRQGTTVARLVPDAGCNVYSIKYKGIEYLRVPDRLSDLPGVGYGNPILYPTPNRVRRAKFNFQGKAYSFKPNSRGNFIHGLVHSQAWKVTGSQTNADSAEVHCELAFQPETDLYHRFPWTHIFRLVVSVREGVVRWTYEVDNRSGTSPLPFGVGYHPYFVYQGKRDQTYLTVPATHWMESVDLLPTGQLVDLKDTQFDLRSPRSLRGLSLDDVFFGVNPKSTAQVEFRDVRRKISLRASEDFTHMVVYTPDRPFFCIENQTCSTDAHNLHDQGHRKSAHLQICPAGELISGWAEYQFESVP